MVGQKKLLSKINSCTLDTFPRTVMLIGDYGCGKHTLCEYISNHFNLPIEDISDSLNLETLEDIYSRVEPFIYLINGDEITDRDEATILKFLEEPLLNSYIIILCENKNHMLGTIINRCQLWEFENYSRDELLNFCTTNISDYFLSIANTPGKIKEWGDSSIDSIKELCNKIIDKISGANFANTLTLTSKLDFGDGNGINFKLFTQVLVRCSLDKMIENNSTKYIQIYKLVNDFSNKSRIVRIDRKKLFEHFLCDLRKVT